jgi:hypothetical protein
MSAIIGCPHCRTRVIAVANRCPACGQDVTAAASAPLASDRPAPAARPRRRPRHLILNAIGVLLIGAGLLRWPMVGVHGLADMAWNLALIWAGTLLILGLMVGGWLAERK